MGIPMASGVSRAEDVEESYGRHSIEHDNAILMARHRNAVYLVGL